jgi:flagellin-like protein
MANFKKNDEAVSAVIGVILMVAITVILAAVIAAFVFQLGGNVPKSKSVGVEVKRTTTAGVIMVKTMSGADIGLLKPGDATTTPVTATYTVTSNGVPAAFAQDNLGTQLPATLTSAQNKYFTANQTGTVQFFGTTGTGGVGIAANADVSVIAHFTDGTEYTVWSGNLA